MAPLPVSALSELEAIGDLPSILGEQVSNLDSEDISQRGWPLIFRLDLRPEPPRRDVAAGI